MSGEFKDYPKSITEARADREQDGAIWTPRDALISFLRDIDNGEAAPSMLVICARIPDPTPDQPDRYRLKYHQANCGDFDLIGLLQMVIHDTCARADI